MLRTVHDEFAKHYASFNGYEEWFKLALAVVLVVYTCVHLRRESKFPRGPFHWPVVGNYFNLTRNPEKALVDLANKYGDVMGLHIGPQFVVFLNSWEATKDAMSQSATLDRPRSAFKGAPYNLGFTGANGEEWIQIRRMATRAMKDIGLHSTRWEELVEEEAKDLVGQILREGQRPIELRSFLTETFANNIMTLVLGERGKTGGFHTKSVAEAVDAIMEATPTLRMANFSEILSRVLQALGLEKKFMLQDRINYLATSVSNLVDEKLRNKNSGSTNCLIDRLQEKLEEHYQSKENSLINADHIKGTVITLLTGGSDTSRVTVMWLLIAMADHPEIQEKVHEELDRVIGKDGSIRWSERIKIPYTLAAFLESMRWKSVVPLTPLRIATEDLWVKGYLIPKGTYLSANTWVMHKDRRYWNEPEKFLPERFLEDDGKKVNASPDSYNPFSYGKRNCPGKLISMMENLQYFTILMQKFKVVPKDGNKAKFHAVFGLTYEVMNVELRFIPR